jgi:hypothetical protein
MFTPLPAATTAVEPTGLDVVIGEVDLKYV